MDRSERILAGLVLVSVTGPVAASDFRGFFSFIVAAPLVASIGLIAAFILARRYALRRKGLERYVPILPLLAAASPWVWLSVFLPPSGKIGVAVLAVCWLVVARWIWLHPHGRVALWLTRILLVPALAAIVFVGWDMRMLLDDPMKPESVAVGAVLFVFCIGCTALCAYASWKAGTRGR
jgi:hypothetical protein